MPCDANALTPSSTATSGQQPFYVWSAAHNPKKNHGPIDPPASGCIPDLPGGKGCPLYSAATDYPVTKGSPLCREVCAAYRGGVRQSTAPGKGIQVAYSCDAALCTTLGIGQTTTPPPAPIRTAGLLRQACGGLDQQSGLKAILALEQANNCSCCASQVCGCDRPGRGHRRGDAGADRRAERQAGEAGDHAAMRDQWDAVREGEAVMRRGASAEREHTGRRPKMLRWRSDTATIAGIRARSGRHDARELLRARGPLPCQLLVDQGLDDKFLGEQLKPEPLGAAAEATGSG